MIRLLVGAVFIIHGLISGAQSGSGLRGNGGGVPNPSWVAWWPTNLGESWLLARLGVESRLVMAVFGVLWLVVMAGFIGAGLSLAGWLLPPHLWRPLAGGAAAISLVLLTVYFHPFFAVAVLLNAGVLLAATRYAV